MKLFNKILIANRGEIAVRIIRTANRLGIKTLAIYTKDDACSLHVSMADEAILLEGDSLAQTYLNQNKILEIAIENGVQAIHPGYGFLSENAGFAKLVQKKGLVFIGSTPEQISLMGEKTKAIGFVKRLNVPVIPSFQGAPDEILANVPDLPFPLLVKASAGGGGKGMQLVNSASDLNSALEKAQQQAQRYFGNEEVFVEKYISGARHIEVQVFGDGNGNVVHLFERECSIQRRHQKLIEESPATSISTELKEKLYRAALLIAKSIQYRGAGTVEFLVDKNADFYFLEMNTRLQVEHPVTEMTTGLDLVEWQLRIAAGMGLPKLQSEIAMHGHSIELRLCAEDSLSDFNPSYGIINELVIPEEPDFRFDSFLKNGLKISPNYDSLLGKLIVLGKNREDAIKKMTSFSQDVVIPGIKTNLSFLRQILENSSFLQNKIDTSFAENNFAQIKAEMLGKRNKVSRQALLVAYSLFHFYNPVSKSDSAWQSLGRFRFINEFVIDLDAKPFRLSFTSCNHHVEFIIEEESFSVSHIHIEEYKISFQLENVGHEVLLVENNGYSWAQANGHQFMMRSNHLLSEAFVTRKETEQVTGYAANVLADLFGKVIKTLVKRGDKVLRNQALLVIESMKTEFRILSPVEGVIKQLHVDIGSVVQDKQLLIEFENKDKITVIA